MRIYRKVTDLVIVFLAVEFIPRLSGVLANLIFPYLRLIDPNNLFLNVSIHHIFQLVLTLVLMKLLYNEKKLLCWGFNAENASKSLEIFKYFCIIFFAQQFAGMAIGRIISRQPFTLQYPLTITNTIGVLSFQGLLSGLCEEPLFRGFTIIVLAQSWKGTLQIGEIRISKAGMIASILFTYAHIGHTIFPFAITHFVSMQLLYSFILGIYYAIVFEKTKSLLGPILSHNFANVTVYLVRYIFVFLIK